VTETIKELLIIYPEIKMDEDVLRLK
jgi:hypothetical protein